MSKKDTRTVKQRNKAVRQEAIREQLAAYGHHTQAVNIIEKLADVDGDKDKNNIMLDNTHIQRLGKALDGHLKLLGKYCPDLKSVELTQDPENPYMEESADARYAILGEFLQSIQRRADRPDTDSGSTSGVH
ncbi:MAG: hypothetical protein V3V74_06925 [Nitrosomonadaceae bacterium]